MPERLAKLASSPMLLVALLCFLLPFFSISCGGAKFVTCSGVQSLSGSSCSVNSDATRQFDTGSVSASPDTSSANTTDSSFLFSRVMLGVALLAIIGGIAASFVLRDRIRALAVGGASAAAAVVLVIYAFAMSSNWTNAISDAIGKSGAGTGGAASDPSGTALGAGLAQSALGQFHEGLEYGFYLAMLLLLAVLVVNALTLSEVHGVLAQAGVPSNLLGGTATPPAPAGVPPSAPPTPAAPAPPPPEQPPAAGPA